MVDRLIRDNVIPPQERGALIGKAGLTDEGKSRLSKLIVGRFFDDPSTLDNTAGSIMQKLQRIAAPVANTSTVQGWDLTPVVKDAVDIVREMRSRGFKSVDELSRQAGMFGGGGYSPEALMLAQRLADDSPLKLVKAVRDFADDAQNWGGKQTSLHPRIPFPQAFQEAFGK
jgi:hypothetical protein